MAISFAYYGSVEEANTYFGMRLHQGAWSGSSLDDRPRAIYAATKIIDTLDFKGYKAPVWALLQQYHLTEIPSAVQLNYPQVLIFPTLAQIAEAEQTQELEFPRGTDTEVPEEILIACYELAYTLLDGRDPELELENLGIVSQGYSSVRTTYSRTHVPVEHIVNGVPNALAWRYIRPFLRDPNQIKLSRVS